MKIRSIAVIVLFCFSVVVNVFSGNTIHAQENFSGTPAVSGPFVSDVVTPAVSQEVWQLRVTEPRDPADPARIFPRRPPKYEIAITKGDTEMIDPLVGVSDGENLSRTPSPDLSFDGMSLQNGGPDGRRIRSVTWVPTTTFRWSTPLLPYLIKVAIH